MGRDNSGREHHSINIQYNPLPSQRKFHSSLARFKGFSGPIGSGKSQALCHEAIRCSFRNPGRLGLVGAPTYPMLRDATQRALFEVMETNNLRFAFNKAENMLQFRDSDSRVLFRSMDEFERLRGTNLAWFGLDELSYTQEEAWLRLEGRLRDPLANHLQGFAVWTPKGFDWVYRKFIKDETGSYDVIRAAPFENRHILDAVPDFYERLRKSYDERFFEQEVLGSYLDSNGGLVYQSFSRLEHLRETEIDSHQPLLWALDFNVDPLCSIVAQVNGEVTEVVDEIVISRATTQMACEEFFKRYRTHPGGIRIYGDASGNNGHTTGASDYQLIREFFRARLARQPEQRIPRANPLVRDRITVVNSRLKNADNEIRLFVNPKCKGLIADFEELSFKEGTTIPDKDRDPKRSHLSDALGYLLWQENQSSSTGEQARRIL